MNFQGLKEWLETQEPRSPSDFPDEGFQEPEPQNNIIDDITDEPAEILGVRGESFGEYLEFISSTKAYRWLLGRLQREVRSTTKGEDAMTHIRDTVVSSFHSVRRISRKPPMATHCAIFELEWNVLDFLESQDYNDANHEVFDNIITLTGSSSDAQASTCAQYLSQTWPVTGNNMVEFVKAMLLNVKKRPHKRELLLLSLSSIRDWASAKPFSQ